MIESQLSICTWADATFGPPVSDASIAARALVEMAELVTACVYGRPAEEIGEEIADVVIVLARLGRSIEVDVVQRIADGAPDLHGPPRKCAAYVADRLGRLMLDLEIYRDEAPFSLELTADELYRTAVSVGINLPAAIDRKMAINRARRWNVDGNGHGWHVKEVLTVGTAALHNPASACACAPPPAKHLPDCPWFKETP